MGIDRLVVGFILQLFVVFAFSPALRSALASSPEAFPSKAITWLVPYSPGGGFDLHSRAQPKE